MPHHPQESQNGPDDYKDNPYGPEDGDACDEADNEQNDAENNHTHLLRDRAIPRQYIAQTLAPSLRRTIEFLAVVTVLPI
jgi:hypothetical protein